jgi:FkbM family methyltransferase
MLRQFAIKILKMVPFDFIINHHWVPNSPIKLNSFRHKGYWWHGRNREQGEMTLLGKLIRPGDNIIEVGGHIGYLSVFFSHLIGDEGKIHVFEPGSENFRYLSLNCAARKNVTVHKKAVSDIDGFLTLYVENLSGQNNSLIKDFSTLSGNQLNAGVKADIFEEKVESLSLDKFVNETKIIPDFVKIDVEGAEDLVLSGMKNILMNHKPTLMLETTQKHDEIFSNLNAIGYVVFNENLKLQIRNSDGFINSFCIHQEKMDIIAGADPLK